MASELGKGLSSLMKDGSGGIAGIRNGKSKGNSSNEQSGESNETGTGGMASVSSQLDSKQGDAPSQTKVPSPNDAERANLSQKSQGGTGNVPTIGGLNNGQRTQGVQQASVQTETDFTSVSDQVQGNPSVINVKPSGASSPSPTNKCGHKKQ